MAENINVLHSILDWSLDKPKWQRDALRRIIVNDIVVESDIKELVELCKVEFQVPGIKENSITSIPLAQLHLPQNQNSENSVYFFSISELTNVNRLPSDQELKFDPIPGLTVIYGDNGSGKSGYARVIKKACKCRGAGPEIQPNLFSTPAKGPATANLSFKVGEKTVDFKWTDNTDSNAELSKVFVFDAASANHYLSDDEHAAFTPFGLDILPKLSIVLDKVNNEISTEIKLIESQINAVKSNWTYKPETQAGKLIDSLSFKTKTDQIEQLATLSKEEQSRIGVLQEALKSDPLIKAKETKASATRIKTFLMELTKTIGLINNEKSVNYKKLIDDVITKEQIAKAFSTEQFKISALEGSGNKAWRKLWDAARVFSESFAYKGLPFPVTKDVLCVLCQQPLDPVAQDRLLKFEELYKDESQKHAEQAKQQLKIAFEELNTVSILVPQISKIETDLASIGEESNKTITEFAKVADERIQKIKDSLTHHKWESEIPDLPISPIELLNQLIQTLQNRANTEESASDPEIRKKLERERNEMEAKVWLAGIKEDLLLLVEKYKQKAKLEECKKSANTKSTTTKNTELTKLIVTEAFCKRFQEETKVLGLNTLEVKLEEIKGRKAETKFGLRLTHAGQHKPKDIASEGEQRSVALAAFLSELSQASHQSALVFDDPVSSLDHSHREKIAARLVKEGKIRQVIVFTHDAVFLNDLQSFATENGLPAAFRYLEWIGDIPGRCFDGLPWDCKSPDERLKKLEDEQRRIKKEWNPLPSQTNNSDISKAYSWLRATIERIVERVVFGDVVFRFRSYVKLKNLNKVIGFEKDECDEINRIFKKCSDVTEAHDKAQGKQAAIPTPEELKTDIDDTKALLQKIKDRIKSKST